MTEPERPLPPARDERLTAAVRLRLLGALIALTAGAAAIVIAVLLVRTALS